VKIEVAGRVRQHGTWTMPAAKQQRRRHLVLTPQGGVTSWPYDALYALLEHLTTSPADLARAGCVCNAWRAVAFDEQLWQQVCEHQSRLLVLQKLGSDVNGLTWRQMYVQRLSTDALYNQDDTPPVPLLPQTRHLYNLGLEVYVRRADGTREPMLAQVLNLDPPPAGEAEPGGAACESPFAQKIVDWQLAPRARLGAAWGRLEDTLGADVFLIRKADQKMLRLAKLDDPTSLDRGYDTPGPPVFCFQFQCDGPKFSTLCELRLVCGELPRSCCTCEARKTFDTLAFWQEESEGENAAMHGAAWRFPCRCNSSTTDCWRNRDVNRVDTMLKHADLVIRLQDREALATLRPGQRCVQTVDELLSCIQEQACAPDRWC
jgi:hypothetical protein